MKPIAGMMIRFEDSEMYSSGLLLFSSYCSVSKSVFLYVYLCMCFCMG